MEMQDHAQARRGVLQGVLLWAAASWEEETVCYNILHFISLLVSFDNIVKVMDIPKVIDIDPDADPMVLEF